MRTVNVYSCAIVKEQEVDYKPIAGPWGIASLLQSVGAHKRAQEAFWVVCIGANGKVTGLHEVCRGAVSYVHVPISEIFKRALLNNATTIVIAHNHPSGSLNPSQEDITLTRNVIAAGRLLNIAVADHIIVTPDKEYFSMAENEVDFDLLFC